MLKFDINKQLIDQPDLRNEDIVVGESDTVKLELPAAKATRHLLQPIYVTNIITFGGKTFSDRLALSRANSSMGPRGSARKILGQRKKDFRFALKPATSGIRQVLIGLYSMGNSRSKMFQIEMEETNDDS
jgi:hypothetical protein